MSTWMNCDGRVTMSRRINEIYDDVRKVLDELADPSYSITTSIKGGMLSFKAYAHISLAGRIVEIFEKYKGNITGAVFDGTTTLNITKIFVEVHDGKVDTNYIKFHLPEEWYAEGESDDLKTEYGDGREKRENGNDLPF